jgi:hypothetical protein
MEVSGIVRGASYGDQFGQDGLIASLMGGFVCIFHHDSSKIVRASIWSRISGKHTRAVFSLHSKGCLASHFCWHLLTRCRRNVGRLLGYDIRPWFFNRTLRDVGQRVWRIFRRDFQGLLRVFRGVGHSGLLEPEEQPHERIVPVRPAIRSDLSAEHPDSILGRYRDHARPVARGKWPSRATAPSNRHGADYESFSNYIQNVRSQTGTGPATAMIISRARRATSGGTRP